MGESREVPAPTAAGRRLRCGGGRVALAAGLRAEQLQPGVGAGLLPRLILGLVRGGLYKAMEIPDAQVPEVADDGLQMCWELFGVDEPPDLLAKDELEAVQVELACRAAEEVLRRFLYGCSLLADDLALLSEIILFVNVEL